MSTAEGKPDRPAPGPEASAADVEADIARTRAELAETVEALTAKFDVKAQAQDKAHDVAHRAGEQLHAAQAHGSAALEQVRDTATDVQGNIRPAVRAVLAGSLAAVVVFAVWRRKR